MEWRGLGGSGEREAGRFEVLRARLGDSRGWGDSKDRGKRGERGQFDAVMKEERRLGDSRHRGLNHDRIREREEKEVGNFDLNEFEWEIGDRGIF